MSRIASIVGLGLASAMMLSTPVFAATATKPAPAATARPAAKPAAKLAVAKPTARKAAPAHVAKAKKNGHFASATLKNGKKVTYNCSLPGNRNKQACHG